MHPLLRLSQNHPGDFGEVGGGKILKSGAEGFIPN